MVRASRFGARTMITHRPARTSSTWRIRCLALFDWPPRANHCSLQPLQYSMLCPCRIEATQVLLAIEYVDGVPIEASFNQCFNRDFGVPRVGDRANDTIGRIRMKPRSVGLVSISNLLSARLAPAIPNLGEQSAVSHRSRGDTPAGGIAPSPAAELVN